MPGRLFLTTPIEKISGILNADVSVESVLTSRLDIEPGTDVVVCDEKRCLREMRWGIIPVGKKNARGRPELKTIINARSETVFEKSVFQGVRRCLVPVDGWYEWTGKVRRKTRWRISSKDGEMLMFAAIYDVWKGPLDTELLQVATLTCEPNDMVKEIHHRMGVILASEFWEDWLSGKEVPLGPAPNDLLMIEQCEEIKK